MITDIEESKQYIFDIVGAIYDVHRKLGPGLNEYVYQEGLEIELAHRNIAFSKEVSFHPFYDGVKMNAEYRLDFLCKGNVIVELKSVSTLNDNHRAQLFNYIRLTGASAVILVNYAPIFAEIERYFYNSESREIYTTAGQRIKQFKPNAFR